MPVCGRLSASGTNAVPAGRYSAMAVVAARGTQHTDRELNAWVRRTYSGPSAPRAESPGTEAKR